MKYVEAHLAVAKEYAKLSKAERLKVACLIIKDGRPISIGINGTPSGYDNTCEIDGITRPEVLHSEVNAIGFCAAKGIATEGCIMVTTHSPCFECAKLIHVAKIKKIYYETEYRLTDSLRFLEEINVMVRKIT